MSRKSLRTSVELNIHSVTCPGVWLHAREDVYVVITLMGQTRVSRRIAPVFPLMICETMQFDKVFYGARHPEDVTDCLIMETLQMDLMQETSFAKGNRLASYVRNAADFLYPDASRPLRRCGCQDQQILMQRSRDFPGISPKLEFSTTTVIKEICMPYNSTLEMGLNSLSASKRKSRSTIKKRTKSRSTTCEKYGRATFSSISRSRSASPYAYDNSDIVRERPPFVVRKAEFSKLAGRVPGTKKIDNKYTKKLKSRSASPNRQYLNRSSCNDECVHCSGVFPESDCMLCRVYRRYSGDPYSEHYHPDCANRIRRSKSPNTSYQAALHASLSPQNTQTGISSASSFHSSLKPTTCQDIDCDSLEALAIDLQKARNRRYY